MMIVKRLISLGLFLVVSAVPTLGATPAMRFGTVEISIDMGMDECLKKLESVFEVEDSTDCLGRSLFFDISDNIKGAVLGRRN